tara:strand:+ start:475 stop:1278 length:804 start_codon:yes stop_codon:yes gene_type:complete
MSFKWDGVQLEDLQIALSVESKAGDWFGNVCGGDFAQARMGMERNISQEDIGTPFAKNRFPVTYLNGNKNIPSNNNLCGIVFLHGKGSITYEWQPEVDNISEEDCKQYLEYAITTPEVARGDYSMEDGVLNLYTTDEVYIDEWHDRASFNYVLKTPVMKTKAVEDDCRYMQIRNPLEWDYRQRDLPPNGLLTLEKKYIETSNDGDNLLNEQGKADCYFFVENEFKVGDKQFEKDTLKKQVSDTLILQNLTDKPNRIVQMWRRSRWHF